MKSISKLKDEARKYEQREEWEKAIQAYLQVLRLADDGEMEVELPLYNRVGDLCLKLEKPQEAVRHYEQAADRYAEAGLYNNAIALCNKALRYSPDRLELIRKLGQFSASQGFITDARRYFLDYAERQFKGGKVTEALGALEDFANVSDDPEIREMLGRQLHAHGRINDAVDELRRAHAMRLREGQSQLAEGLRAEILAIDPHAKVDGGAAAPADTRSQRPAALPGLVDIEPAAAPDRPLGSEPLEVADFEDPGTGTVEGLQSDGVSAGDVQHLEPLEVTGFDGASEMDLADIDASRAESGIDGLETTNLDFAEVEGSAPALEDLGIEREDMSFGDADAARDAETFELPTLDDPDTGFDLPTLDDPDTGFDLPTLDDPDTGFEFPTLDDPDAATDLPAADETGSFDLPLLGDDEHTGPRGENEPAASERNDPSDLDFTRPPEPDDAGLGGDLPLDLSSFGSPFDLSSFGEPASDSPEWKDDPGFDLPTIDGEALGLPTWEAEPAPAFDIPTFDTPPDEAEPVEDEPVVEEPTFDMPTLDTRDAPAVDEPKPDIGQPTADKERTEPRPPTNRPAPKAAHPPAKSARKAIDVPAIELPTWETDPVSGSLPEWIDGSTGDAAEAEEIDAGPAGSETGKEAVSSGSADAGDAADEPAYETNGESAEPSWVEAASDVEDDTGPDLPTFTYDDDDFAPAPIDGGDGVDADQDAAPAEDDDPLGLAAHLPGYVAPDPVTNPPRSGQDRMEPLDSAWLDEIADDEPTAPDDAAAPDEPAAVDEPATRAAADQAGATRGAPAEDAGTNVGDAPAAPAKGGYIDLGAFLTADEERESTRFRVQETAPTGDEDRDFAELLSQFKSKVQEHLPPEDAVAHYDLGLAFKEMGLTDEAIGEFQIALRAGHMRLRVYEELGQCFLEKEQYNIAEKVLRRALDMKFDDELELLGVYYHLGRACEALGKREEARDAYERVLGMDINFGDVTDRLARL